MRVDKKTKILHGLASVLISLAMASAFAFPLAAFADEPEAPDTGAAAAVGAAATAAGEDAGSDALAEDTGSDAEPADAAADPAAPVVEEGTLERAAPGEAPGPGYSAYGGAWALYTGSLADDITTFAITSGAGAGTTGHITVGSPGQAPLLSGIGEASYYVTSPDGRMLTYTFDNNDFSTTYLTAQFQLPNTIGGNDLISRRFGTFGIDEVYTQEASPGYTAVQLRSYGWVVDTSLAIAPAYLDIYLTLTPQPDGTVVYDLEFISRQGNPDIGLAVTVTMDVQLRGDDSPTVYSLGTDQGMYAATADGSATATFPWLVADGASDMAAAQYDTNIFDIFADPSSFYIGSKNVSRGVPSSPGDLLLSGIDSAVFILFGSQTLNANDSRTMSYAVNLALGPDAALPATGDSSPLALAGGLGVLAVGTALAAASRRYRRKDTD